MARRTAAAKSGMTLGFIGGGQINPADAFPLLENLLADVEGDVKAIFPLTQGLFTDSMAEIGNWLAEQNIPYEVVIDEEAAKDKALKEWIDDAAKSHKVVEVTNKLVGILESSPEPRLIVLWDEDDGVSEDTTSLANEKGVKALDLEQGLEEIELQGEGDPDPADDLAGETAAAKKDAEEPGEDEPYTREELEAMEDIELLKEICKVSDIDIPARSRKSTYVEAILKAQKEDVAEAGDDEAEIPDEAPEAPEAPRRGRVAAEEPSDEAEAITDLSDDDWDGLRDMAEGIVEDVTSRVNDKLERILQLIGNLGINIDKLTQAPNSTPVEDEPPSTGVRKRAGSAKAAAPKEEAGMTKDEAKAIIEEWGGKRGRPNAEVTEARAVLGLDQPQPSRPVGRPRKAASK